MVGTNKAIASLVAVTIAVILEYLFTLALTWLIAWNWDLNWTMRIANGVWLSGLLLRLMFNGVRVKVHTK